MEKRIHYIKAGWLADGSGDIPKKNVLLEITDGKFSNIEVQAHPDCCPKDDVTDLSHCTISPPFVDSHVHLSMSGTFDRNRRRQQLKFDYTSAVPVIAHHIREQLLHGVVAVRDGGDRLGAVLRYKNALIRTGGNGLAIASAGRAWHQKGRYGSLIGRFPGDGESLSSAIARDEEVADHLKLVNSGLNSLDMYGKETRPQFGLNELNKVIAQAEKRKLKVMVHANGKIPVQTAVKAGCHSIEHGYFMGDDNMKLMSELQTCWVPTVYTMGAYLEAIRIGVVAADSQVVAATLEHQINQLSLARKYGVMVAAGTDSGSTGVFHGAALGEELKLFTKAGYPFGEVIRCASFNGAKLIGIGDEYGLVAKGRQADFLALKGSPGKVPENLFDIEAIYMDGEQVSY